MSVVFQNINHPPPHCPASVYPPPPPAFGAGGGHTRWVERGGGVNILEDARHSSVLYICKYFVDLYIFGGRIRSSEAAMDGGARSAPFKLAMSSKRRVRAAHGRLRAAKTHQLNIFSYEISLSCGTFKKHDCEPLFGLGPVTPTPTHLPWEPYARFGLNPMPESTLSHSHELRIWPLQHGVLTCISRPVSRLTAMMASFATIIVEKKQPGRLQRLPDTKYHH